MKPPQVNEANPQQEPELGYKVVFRAGKFQRSLAWRLVTQLRVHGSSGLIAGASGFCVQASGIYPSLARWASRSFWGNFSLKFIDKSTVKHRKFSG